MQVLLSSCYDNIVNILRDEKCFVFLMCLYLDIVSFYWELQVIGIAAKLNLEFQRIKLKIKINYNKHQTFSQTPKNTFRISRKMNSKSTKHCL